MLGSDDQRTTTAEVTNKWESEKEILRYRLADGTDLRSSEDHRVMVGDDDQVDWKEGREIEVGDYLLKPRTLNVDSERVPTLSDLIPVECQRFGSTEAIKSFKSELPSGAVSELASEFGLATGTLYHPDTDIWTPERCQLAADRYDVALPDGGREYRRTRNDLDRELTDHELYLAGLVLTDGTMSSDDGIRFYNTREELHQQFPGETHLEPDGKGCYKQNVLDYTRMYAFNGLGIPFGDKNEGDVDLSTVFELPESYIERFLAGVIDGDGHVSSSVTVAAENRSIGRWYVKLFRRLGIYAEQRENVVRVPDAEREIQRLRDRILPHLSHSEKRDALKALDGGKSGRSENIPYALFEADTGTDERRIGRDKHRRGISLKRHETTLDEWQEYVFVKVEDVERVGTETTYDIETTTHNFFADDCLVHNCEDFDVPYFLDRMEEIDPASQYDLSADRLSRVDEVWRSGWGGPDIKGRVVFDLLYGYKRTQFTELDSYRLDAVGELELGVGKERYAGDIGDLWEDDPKRLLEYNLRDVELCVEIDRKQGLIDFWDEVRKFVGCKLEDAPTPGDAVDQYVLHKAYGKFALPTKGQQESEEFEGGAVFEPITGVRENISVLDLKSLYPMCMVTINAGPETKVDDDYEGDTYRAPNGTQFRKEPDGIMREMVDELLTEREEKKELRNQHEPDSSAYEIYDTQQAAVKVIMNCFTPDTEALTPAGVRDITELAVGDQVYSLDPETQELEIKPVTETHAYPDYRDELVDIETSKIDFRVTPNHRMLVRKNDRNGITEDGYSFVEAGDLEDYCNYELPHDWTYDGGNCLETVDLTEFVDDYEVWVRPSVHGHTFTAELGFQPRRVPKADVDEVGYVFTPEEFEANREYIESVCERSFIHTESGRKWIPRTYDGDDYLAFLAWYITEGNVYTSDAKEFGDNYRGSATTVQIAQEAVADGGSAEADHHAAIGELLDRMGLDYYVDDRSYQFTSKLFGDLLEDLCGDDSFSKRIPELVFEASTDQKERFLSVLIDGDGDRQPNSWRYSTSSETLRDDVLRLCTHLGITASYNADSGTWRIYVSEDSKNSVRMHRSGSRSTADDGVYCVTVADNHTLLAGRNGKFQFVGQSLYGVTGWDRFRLYDKEGAAAVTATGREVIDFTETVASELDYEVAYGDSVTGDRPVVVRDPDGIVRVLPIADLFERATASTGDTVVITADGGAVGSAPGGKDRRRLDGWEALSLAADGEPEWQPIQQAIRHEVDKPVVTLQHKFGESTTTRDHSYVVDDDGELVEATPDDVDEPLRIPGMPAVDTVETIDVYDVLDGYTREYEDGRSVGSEESATKTKRVHANEEWVWFGHDHHNELSKPVKVQRYIDIDSEDGAALLRLLAAYITEGGASTIETTESRFGASISESHEAWLEGIQSDYYRLFENTTVSVIASDSTGERTVEYETSEGSQSVTYDDATYKLQLMSELAAVFFREFAGQTSRGKRIPGFVFNLSTDAQDLFLDTLIEGDGSRKFPRYTDEYCERHFDFETTSRELAAGLSMLLTQREQKHSLKYRDAKDSYTIRTCDSYRSGRDPVCTEVDHDGYVYDLSVADNENFVDGVGGVVLHNTDSVMLELDDDVSKSEAIEQSFEIEEHINSRYDDFARDELNADDHRFQIEFEKLYRRFFQAGRKKRYAGHIIWKEGKDVDDIDITGFEYKRSDIAPITKQVQKEVIETIVTGDDMEADREEVREYLTTVIEEFLDGERSVEEIGIPGGIGKRLDAYETPTAQVRGAQYANLLLGTNFDRGSKPKRLYLEDVHSSFFRRMEAENGLDPREDPLYGEFKRDPDVICFEFADQIPDEFEIDLEKMLDKTLKGPISRVIEALDMSWDEIKTGQTQTGLEQYW
ncbi:MAG: DNA polymerase domain-containing protein [Halonotius sp.]